MSFPETTEKISKAPYPEADEENDAVNITTAEMYTVPRGRGEVKIDKLRNRVPILKQLNQFEAWMDKLFGIETTGADRILENERKPPNVLNVCNRLTNLS